MALLRVALMIAVITMAAAPPPSALADADPASDILLGQSAFYPYQPPVSRALEATMERVLGAAARAGLPLKVAVIGSREDLGAVPDFFGHPQQYARFLDREISFNDRPSLLVVMPAGFGLVAAGPPAALSRLRIDTHHGSYGLVRTAILAVVSLVRASGRTIATPSIPSASSPGGTPGILFVLPIALLALAGLAAWRGRPDRGQAEEDRSTVRRPSAPSSSARSKARRVEHARALRRRRRVALAALVVALGLALSIRALLAHHPAGRTPGTAAPAASAAPRPPAAPGSRTGGELAAVRRMARYGLPLFCGGRSKRMVALTFDDGPGVYTHLAIRKLREHHLRATFFLVGKEIRAFPGLAALEKPVGAFGDHTMTHPFLPALGRPEMVQELAGAKTLIERATARPVVLFRPPYEGRSPAIDREARALGMLEVLWNVDSADSLGANYVGIESNVLAGLHPGSIILMHENRGQTIRALPTIFRALARDHLRAMTIPELVERDPPSLAQLRAGGLGCGVSLRAGSGS